MDTVLTCTDQSCAGTINLHKYVTFDGYAAYPCKKCGKLHWSDDTAVEDQQGNKQYLVGKEIVAKQEPLSLVV
jgi:hypothetical protein